MLLYIFMALLLFGGWKYIVDYLQGAVSELSGQASALQATLQWMQTVAGVSAQTISRLLDAAVAALIDILSTPSLLYAKFAISIVQIGFFIFLSNLLIFSAYWARGALCNWVPPALDREASILLAYYDRIWGNYLAGIGLFAFVLGAFSIVEYWLLGVPYPAVFGILTGLICLLPLIGGFLSGLVVFIPCLLFGSLRFPQLSPLAFAILVTLINDLLCQISYNFIALPIIGKLVKLPYWVVLSGTMLGFAVNSILFAFIVIPVFSTLRVSYTYLLAKILGREPFPDRERPGVRDTGFLSQLLLDEKSVPVSK
jgi:predicted PurR-regulated permease PerM